MSRSVIIFITIVAFLVLCQGCGKNRFLVEPGHIITNSCDMVYTDLPDKEKIAIIGNLFITKEEIESEKKAYMAMLRVHRPEEYQSNLKDGGRTVIGSLVSKFLYQAAFSLESEASKVVPERRFIDEGMKSVSNYCKNAKITYETFLANYRGGEAELKKKIERDARIKTFFDSKFKEKLEVTQEEVDKLHQSIMDGNAESAKTNELYAAEFKSLRRKIIAEKLVFTDNQTENKISDDYELDFFVDAPATRFDDEEKFAVMINETKVGEWSAVIDCGDTLDIFMVTNVTPRTFKTPPLYSGLRIYREKDHGYLQPDKEQLKEDIRKRKNIATLEPYVKELQLKYGVTFPYGFIWQNVKPTAKKGKTK